MAIIFNLTSYLDISNYLHGQMCPCVCVIVTNNPYILIDPSYTLWLNSIGNVHAE